MPAGRYVVWSDIPNDRLLRWDETNGVVSVFRQPAGYVNGNTLDRQGRLVCCEQGNRRVTRTEHDGSITVLADQYQGQAAQQPQRRHSDQRRRDLVHRPRLRDPQRLRRTSGRKRDRRVQRVPDRSGHGRRRTRRGEPARAERHRRRRRGASPPRLRQPGGEVLAYDLGSDRRTVGPGRVAARARMPGFDNIRLDGDGRLWVAAGADGVHCYHQDGTLLGRIVVPEVVANINWGGPKRNRLLIAATTSLYSLLTAVSGPQPTRATPLLDLRPMSDETAAALLAGKRPTDVTTVEDYPTEFSVGMAPSVGTGSPLGPFLIHRREDGVVIGDIGGGFTAPGQVELGYAIARSCQGQGHASVAVKAFLSLARHAPDVSLLDRAHPTGPPGQRPGPGEGRLHVHRNGHRRARRQAAARAGMADPLPSTAGREG